MTPQDESTFTAFVTEHGDGLLRYARMLFGGLHDAEDGLQTALLRVARNWSKASRSPVAYSRTALRNLAADGGRRRHLLPVPSDAEPTCPPEPDLADAQAAAAHLDALLSVLPPRQRVAIVLRVIDGMSEAEAATAMKCSAGTVKSNLSRGLVALRGRMAPLTPHERTAP